MSWGMKGGVEMKEGARGGMGGRDAWLDIFGWRRCLSCLVF